MNFFFTNKVEDSENLGHLPDFTTLTKNSRATPVYNIFFT